MTYIDIVLRNTLLRVVCNLCIVHLFLVALDGGESWLLRRDWNQKRLQLITIVLPMSWATDRTKHAQLHAILHVRTHQIDKHSEWPKPVTDGGDKAKISKIICACTRCGAWVQFLMEWYDGGKRYSYTNNDWVTLMLSGLRGPAISGRHLCIQVQQRVCRCCFLLTF